jgi:hypothetical protein
MSGPALASERVARPLGHGACQAYAISTVSGQPMKPAEEPAGLAIADELGGKLVPRDGPGAPDRTHDFDIELGVGKTVSLEVTASVDEGKLRKAKPLEMGWGQTGLKGNWVLVIDDHARPSVRRFKKEALQLLLALEHGGIANLDVDEPDSVAPMADALREQMRALGIGAAVSDPRSTPAGNVAVWTLEVDSVLRDLNRLNALVEHEIRENIAKLAVTNGDERHLFIWIDPSQTDIPANSELASPTSAAQWRAARAARSRPTPAPTAGRHRAARLLPCAAPLAARP